MYISGPTINPSGFLYSHEEIYQLLYICARNAATVVIGTSFSGLEFQTDRWTRWDLEGCLDGAIYIHNWFPFYLLGDLSLELTMAGHNLGFLISYRLSLVEYSFPTLSQPHSTLKYTFRKLLSLKHGWDQRFINLIVEQKETVKNRANHLIFSLIPFYELRSLPNSVCGETLAEPWALFGWT